MRSGTSPKAPSYCHRKGPFLFLHVSKGHVAQHARGQPRALLIPQPPYVPPSLLSSHGDRYPVPAHVAPNSLHVDDRSHPVMPLTPLPLRLRAVTVWWPSRPWLLPFRPSVHLRYGETRPVGCTCWIPSGEWVGGWTWGRRKSSSMLKGVCQPILRREFNTLFPRRWLAFHAEANPSLDWLFPTIAEATYHRVGTYQPSTRDEGVVRYVLVETGSCRTRSSERANR